MISPGACHRTTRQQEGLSLPQLLLPECCIQGAAPGDVTSPSFPFSRRTKAKCTVRAASGAALMLGKSLGL